MTKRAAVSLVSSRSCLEVGNIRERGIMASKQNSDSDERCGDKRLPEENGEPNLAMAEYYMQQALAGRNKPPDLFKCLWMFDSPANDNREKRPAQEKQPAKPVRDTIVGKDGKTYRRVKTGRWRSIITNWMTCEVRESSKCLQKMRKQAFTKVARKCAKGDLLYGKDGSGHAGYGTGVLQRWADKMVREGKNPYFVDLRQLPVSIKRAYDELNGGDFRELFEQAKKDKHHYLREVFKRIKDMIPGAHEMTLEDLISEVERRFYILQFGPNGYVQIWNKDKRCIKRN